MYDLVCVIPLYGEDCKDVSLRMVASLAIQKTTYSVKYLFYYDDTVPKDAILQIMELLTPRNIQFDIIYSSKTCSGFKRNLGLEYARKNSKYVWLIDQDDYLVRYDSIQAILNLCTANDLGIFKVSYAVPDNVGENNINIIKMIPTMPWQYVVKTDLLETYKFSETLEYGSDIPYSIRLLVMNGYMKVNKDLSVTYVRLIPSTKDCLYFYNYLNENSYMYYHAVMGKEGQEDEQNLAFKEIAKVKEEYENKYGVSDEDR